MLSDIFLEIYPKEMIRNADKSLITKLFTEALLIIRENWGVVTL